MDARDPETYAIIGAAMEVHRQLKHGLAEPLYQEALQIECDLRGIPVEREKWLVVHYKGHELSTKYRADFVCFGRLIVECKTLPVLGNVELAQVLNYLRVTRLERALILNFGTPSLQHRRVIWSEHG